MKVRWISLGVAIGLSLALMVGFAFASDRSAPVAADGSGRAALTQAEPWAGMEAMHDSPAMQRLHAQMPEELQAQCQAMHEQMEQMMGPDGMMGGDMSSHHPGMTGEGMMGPGSGSLGGMMGSGPGDMMGS